MNDEERTTPDPPEEPQEPDTAEPETAPTEAIETGSGPKRLLRSRDDRMLAGVAGGLGRYFQVDPVIFRIGFAVSVLFGGLGALAYLALALFVPSDPLPGGSESPSPAPAQRSRWLAVAAGVAIVLIALSAAGSLLFWGDWGWGWGGDGPWGLLVLVAIGAGAYAILRNREPGTPLRGRRLVAAIALAIVGAIGLAVLALASAFLAATGGGAVIAAVVVAIGALLALAAFRGGARWLIAPALALAIPLGAVSAGDISFAGSLGERHYEPETPIELQDRYELGVGELVVDLREFDWESQRAPVPVEVDLGIGQAIVVVPEDVCVTPDLHVGAGELEVGGHRLDGADLDEVETGTSATQPETGRDATGSAAQPSLELDGEVDLGSLRVLNEWERDHGPPFGHFDRDSEARADVC